MPILQGRKILLQQVFANLISNAIKHHHSSHGKIEISVRDLKHVYEFGSIPILQKAHRLKAWGYIYKAHLHGL